MLNKSIRMTEVKNKSRAKLHMQSDIEREREQKNHKRDWKSCTELKWKSTKEFFLIEDEHCIVKLCTSHHVAWECVHTTWINDMHENPLTQTISSHLFRIRIFVAFPLQYEKYDEIDGQREQFTIYVLSFTLWNYYLIIIFLGIFMRWTQQRCIAIEWFNDERE